jgi:two-component sensor histidine kinase
MAVGAFVPPVGTRIVPAQRTAGLLAVTTVAARPSRTAGPACLPFHDYLRELCADHAAERGMPGHAHGPVLSCTASEVRLPVGVAVILGMIAEELIGSALAHGFPRRRGGRIAVILDALAAAWQLTVEDSGLADEVTQARRESGLLAARLLVLELDAVLERADSVIGGCRWTVTLLRPLRRHAG